GTTIPDDGKKNLCEKAWELMHEQLNIPPVDIYLHKNIPTGAGLGGGSADAAFTLKMLNDLFHLALSRDQLSTYAAILGSDCPFFIFNEPCFAKGRGEILEPISLDLSGYELILVMPPVHVSTKEAFEGITPRVPENGINHILSQPVHSWKDRLGNDFESGIFNKYPQIKTVKTGLLELGADYASMSGSGAAVYAVFRKGKKPANIKNHFPGCFYWEEAL
ncbi:MAG: 4-(cytidine 5'-diphospho)-2-C-methyl-D-erythritol kinase, partial [Bacteroidota bacterium]